MDSAFSPAVAPPDGPPAAALWFLFSGYNLLVGPAGLLVPQVADPADLGLSVPRRHYLGRLQTPSGAFDCWAGDAGEEGEPGQPLSFEGLRSLYGRLDDEVFSIAGRAVQIVDWDRTHRYCGRCGSATVDETHERVKRCPVCGLTSYPRLAPAVIVRVERLSPEGQPQILLARNHRFPAGMYSVLAGFVEPGETLEGCVEREVEEESAIRVGNIRYFGSQPWPFPHSLMIAFVADYLGGEPEPEPGELDDVRWFGAGELPRLPGPPSIARRLIDDWLAATGRA
jgi:NAD+ diphosphatase